MSLIALLVALSLGAWADGARLVALALLAAGVTLGSRAVRSAGLTMGNVLQEVGASGHGDRSPRSGEGETGT
jgi:hypothetical protein